LEGNFAMTDTRCPEPQYRIAFDFDKAARWPAQTGTDERTGLALYRGYGQRPAIPLTGIVLHSTEGKLGELFAAACRYIRDSPDVSAHYYVAADGTIQRILDPGPWRAYHAGVSSWQGRADCNDFMVGIELHHTRGQGPYPAVQLGALAWLCRELMHDHPTITRAGIAPHRAVALPAGRKYDPSDWSDAQLQAWIAAL
jgi:N-acetylmuramoyl-L-alanine amidase